MGRQDWCIPQNASSLVVYYNRALFDAARLSYPAAGWTWDDFLQTARALTRDMDGDGQDGPVRRGRIAPSCTARALYLAERRRLSMTRPAHPARPRQPGSAGSLPMVRRSASEGARDARCGRRAGRGSSETRFMNGRLAMFFNSRRGVTTFRTVTGLDWDVAPLPVGATAASILHSDGFCMAAKAHDKESAWTLIEFANGAEGQTIMAGTGRTVPRCARWPSQRLSLTRSNGRPAARSFWM